MKKYLMIIVGFLAWSYIAQGQDAKAKQKYEKLLNNSCMSDLDFEEITVKYWKLKDDFENYFMEYSVDDLSTLTNDGIGEWDDSKCAYQYAGYNLPAYSYELTASEYNSKRHYGETPVRLGQLIATACMEYRMYKRGGKDDLAQITLNKIFLFLQAYRRIDMMGNKLMEVYYNSCGNSVCPDFVADVSGYTGFIVRDDVPFDFGNGHVDSTIAHYKSDYTDSDMTRLLNSMSAEGLISTNPSFCDMACYFPRNEQKKNGGNMNTITQDQLIGILQGMMYVKRLIPEEEANVEVNNKVYNVVEMAKEITSAIKKITNGCSNNMMFPGCKDCKGSVEAKNAGVGIYYYGLAHIAKYITGEPVLASMMEKIGWSLSAGVESAAGFGQQHNIRMYNKVSTYANLNVTSETLEDALQAGNLVTPLELILFHDNYKVFKGDRNPFDGNAPKKWRDRYCELLSSYPIEGAINVVDQNITERYGITSNTNGIWCNGSPLESNLKDCNRNSVFSPLEFIYLYDLLAYLEVVDVAF